MVDRNPSSSWPSCLLRTCDWCIQAQLQRLRCRPVEGRALDRCEWTGAEEDRRWKREIENGRRLTGMEPPVTWLSKQRMNFWSASTMTLPVGAVASVSDIFADDVGWWMRWCLKDVAVLYWVEDVSDGRLSLENFSWMLSGRGKSWEWREEGYLWTREVHLPQFLMRANILRLRKWIIWCIAIIVSFDIVLVFAGIHIMLLHLWFTFWHRSIEMPRVLVWDGIDLVVGMYVHKVMLFRFEFSLQALDS